MTLAEHASAVKTREDLARFIKELKVDLLNHSNDWENADLASFLDAMAAWIKDMDGYYKNTGQKQQDITQWRFITDMLMASRVYE
jgi:hypothetical protein